MKSLDESLYDFIDICQSINDNHMKNTSRPDSYIIVSGNGEKFIPIIRRYIGDTRYDTLCYVALFNDSKGLWKKGDVFSTIGTEIPGSVILGNISDQYIDVYYMAKSAINLLL